MHVIGIRPSIRKFSPAVVYPVHSELANSYPELQSGHLKLVYRRREWCGYTLPGTEGDIDTQIGEASNWPASI